jgi:Protein of unknown function (DUF2721)
MSILQAAITPLILVTGTALLILAMTDRFGRVVDRSRKLAEALRKALQPERDRLGWEVQILIRRAYLLRAAMSFAILSVLLAAILVNTLFIASVLRVEAVSLTAILFIGCLLSLIVSLLIFLQDINLSLGALKLELQPSDDDTLDPQDSRIGQILPVRNAS